MSAPSELLRPLTIGDVTLSNRLVMAPLTRGRTGLGKNSRVPTDINALYYEQRASAGLIIAEATAISDEGFGSYGAPALYNDEHVVGWQKVTDRVHSKGGKIFLQLWHMGRQSHSSYHTVREIVSPSAIAVKGEVTDANNAKSAREVPRALETEEVEQRVQDYINSARLAKQAGFDGVEVHAANGYLIDQFLQSVSNKRTDKYGGSIENRYRFLREIVEGLLTIFPSNRIGIRVSPNGVFGDMGSEDNDVLFPYVAQQLKQYNLAYLHVMDGLGFGFHNKCAAVTLYLMKKAFEGPIMGNIGFTKATAEGALRTGAVDLISFGRLYISNPDLKERFEKDLPLEPPAPMDTWYGDNAEKNGLTGKGYTDFKVYAAESS